MDADAAGNLPGGDRGPAIVAVQIVMIVVATLAVALRFIARRISAAGIWWDDYTILVALVFSLGVNAVSIAAVPMGLGKHIWHAPNGGKTYLRSLFGLGLIYNIALALNKYGILLMYKRLFGIERKMTYAIYAVAGIVTAWFISVQVATLLQCTPLRRFWDYDIPGTCVNIFVLFKASAIPNVIIDFMILIMPQPLIWRLKLSLSNKIALCGIFLLGAFTAVNSVGRLVSIANFTDQIDFTWQAFAPVIWYSLEPAVGITCACLPCLGPLFRGLPGSPFASKNNSERTNHQGSFSRSSWAGSTEALNDRKTWLSINNPIQKTRTRNRRWTSTDSAAALCCAGSDGRAGDEVESAHEMTGRSIEGG